jgi:hypothetical protein
LVLIDVVRDSNFVDSAGHFDSEVFGVQFFEALWALNVC